MSTSLFHAPSIAVATKFPNPTPTTVSTLANRPQARRARTAPQCRARLDLGPSDNTSKSPPNSLSLSEEKTIYACQGEKEKEKRDCKINTQCTHTHTQQKGKEQLSSSRTTKSKTSCVIALRLLEFRDYPELRKRKATRKYPPPFVDARDRWTGYFEDGRQTPLCSLGLLFVQFWHFFL